MSLHTDVCGDTGDRVIVNFGDTPFTLDGQPQPIKIDQVFGSRYVVAQAEQGSGRLEVAW